jgi:hypothetical protein
MPGVGGDEVQCWARGSAHTVSAVAAASIPTLADKCLTSLAPALAVRAVVRAPLGAGLLLGCDRVLLPMPADGLWRVVPVPALYAADNAPLRVRFGMGRDCSSLTPVFCPSWLQSVVTVAL